MMLTKARVIKSANLHPRHLGSPSTGAPNANLAIPLLSFVMSDLSSYLQLHLKVQSGPQAKRHLRAGMASEESAAGNQHAPTPSPRHFQPPEEESQGSASRRAGEESQGFTEDEEFTFGCSGAILGRRVADPPKVDWATFGSTVRASSVVPQTPPPTLRSSAHISPAARPGRANDWRPVLDSDAAILAADSPAVDAPANGQAAEWPVDSRNLALMGSAMQGLDDPADVSPRSTATGSARPSLAEEWPPALAKDGPSSLAKDCPPSLAKDCVGPSSQTMDGPPALTEDSPAFLAMDGPFSLIEDSPACLAPSCLIEDSPASLAKDGPASLTVDCPASPAKDGPASLTEDCRAFLAEDGPATLAEGPTSTAEAPPSSITEEGPV